MFNYLIYKNNIVNSIRIIKYLNFKLNNLNKYDSKIYFLLCLLFIQIINLSIFLYDDKNITYILYPSIYVLSSSILSFLIFVILKYSSVALN